MEAYYCNERRGVEERGPEGEKKSSDLIYMNTILLFQQLVVAYRSHSDVKVDYYFT